MRVVGNVTIQLRVQTASKLFLGWAGSRVGLIREVLVLVLGVWFLCADVCREQVEAKLGNSTQLPGLSLPFPSLPQGLQIDPAATV